MPNVVVLPNVTRQLGRFFGEVADQHIPELLSQLDNYMRKTTVVIDQCEEGEAKNALIAQHSAILRSLELARMKASQL